MTHPAAILSKAPPTPGALALAPHGARVLVERWGITGVAEAWRRQRELAESLTAEGACDRLIFTEHPPTFTVGSDRNADHWRRPIESLRAEGFEVVMLDRGGAVTYHGPGQIVGYPILRLDRYRPDVAWYLRALEEVVIRSLADLGLDSGRDEAYTGVFVGRDKICAVGVRVQRWVTLHGLALNVATDLAPYRNIVPCGLSDRGVTSVERALAAGNARAGSAKTPSAAPACAGTHADGPLLAALEAGLCRHFAAVFGAEVAQS